MRQLISPSDQDSDIADDLHPTISEEIQDLMMSSDGDTPGSYNPPPHIAARIYKNPTNRRKSSAASSRRNSMTSHHSNRSNRSCHGGPQSAHVAQHLRRASIIESRKAKAADRNAHAEKVRLRAAMNKAAPRVTTDSEERALAAQQARERFLAQVKANCAAEVKRSKRVAEEQREKRAAEHLKLKEIMEERHADAERRKALLQLQRRLRTATLPTTDEAAEGKKAKPYVWKPNSETKAAKIIQQAWRDRSRRKTIQDFMELGLSVQAVQKATLEEVRDLLSEDRVVSYTARLLKALGLTEDDDSAQEKSAVRAFLSAFIVLGHPEQVLSKEGEQEKDLINKAQGLLLQLNQVIDATATSTQPSTPPPLADLSEAYSSFQRAFRAWKTHDSSFMISSMVAQFVELDAIWQSVKDDTAGEVANDYKEGIQHNQTLVLVQLKKLAGPERAMKLIKNAIRASRKSRMKKLNGESQRSQPRVASTVADSSEPPLAAAVESITAHSAVSRPENDERSAAKERLQSSSSLVPESREIVHELAINKEWKIDIQQREDMRDAVIEDTARQLQTALDAGLGEVWIPALAESIQQKLASMLAPDTPFQNMIMEALDPKLVASQIANGSFSYQNFFSFMNSVLPKLCAPVRDEVVKNLAANPSDDPVKQLARIYFIIDLMVLDMLNFQLMRLAPTLLSESVGYESRAFSETLGGKFPDRTLKWWRDSTAKVHEEATRRNSESASSSVNKETPNKMYMQGLVDVAITTTPIREDELPETLELDRRRFTRIRADVLRIITIGSILLSAKNLLRRDTRSLWKAEAQRMWDLPFSAAPTAFVSIIESRYALPPITKQQITGNITRIMGETKDGEANHPVTKVMLKKIKAHVLTRLSASSAEERIRASTTAMEFLGASGMPEFVGRIGDMVQELGRVADVDREAHAEWYDKVAEKVAEDDASIA